jgi:hypothetical protein
MAQQLLPTMTLKQGPSAFRTALRSALALLTVATGVSQVPQRSPSELIRYLTWQSDRPGREDLAASSNACGTLEREGQEDRPAIRALVGFGASAIPDLEAAFDVIEARGLGSGFAGHEWPLFRAYAEIKGPAAYPRLRKMIRSPQFDFPLVTVRAGLDSAIALSFGLTSYVSAVRTPAKTFNCLGDKPQDILDQLILAWERDDRTWLEQQLGPNAVATLSSLLNGRTWADMRGQLWPGKSNPGAAVGYRFQAAVPPAQRPPGPPSIEINTLFKSAVGSDCGSYRVRFYTPTYLVDNQDLEGLLRLIASCATGADASR